MSSKLFVIEAPGKRAALKALLGKIGLRNVEVVATIGHLAGNPDSLATLHVDRNLRETAYRVDPAKEGLVREIASKASQVDVVYLATDDDQEGDVIARDVWRFCLRPEDRPKASRLQLRAVTPGELRLAISEARPFDPATAAKGDARRVVDRLIGCLSDREGAVGRVQGSLLIALLKEPMVQGVVTHTLSSRDGRGDFLCREAVYAGAPVPSALQIDAGVSVATASHQAVAGAPWGFEGIVLAASLRTSATPREVSQAMQDLYEKGRLTYPRSRGTSLSVESARRVGELARSVGAGFNGDLFKAVREPGLARSHEAPNPIDLDVPVNRPFELLPLHDQVLVTVAQQLINCGIAAVAERPCQGDLPAEAQGKAWVRLRPIGTTLWPGEPVPSGYRPWTAEQSVFQYLAQREMGRPSTIVEHVSKFLTRRLCTQALDLNDKGKAWAFKNASLLGYENLAKKIEFLIDCSKDDSSTTASRIISECDLHAVEAMLDSRAEKNDAVEGPEVHPWELPGGR